MSREPCGLEPQMEALEASLTAIASASAAPDVFRSLLEASRVVAPRAAVFLSREGVLKGWVGIGLGAAAARRLKSLRIAPDDAWLAPLSDPGRSGQVTSLDPGLAPPELDPQGVSEAMGVAFRVGDRVIAALVAERGPEEAPWSPAALGILRIAVELRLELDLLRRRARPSESPAPSPGAPPLRGGAVEHPSGASPEEGVEPGPESDRGGEASLTPLQAPAPPTPDALHREDARRFARLVATDIRLYNEEAILLGRRNGDLARRLAEPLARGRETFERRFAELGAEGREILHEAYVQVLAGGDPALLPLS